MESSLRSLSGPRIKYTPDDSPYEAITVDKLTPIIGGEIGGVDLRAPSNRQMDEIHRALAENLVIFFRDQHLSQEQHLDFGRKFGDLHIHPAAPAEPGHPGLMVIHADKDSPRANGEGWHSDVSCDPEPPMGSILYIKKCPPKGGDTLFRSDQHLSQEQHLDFGRKFGDLHIHPAAPAEPGHPGLMVIHADKDSPRANGEGWHSDVSCDPEPPMGSILYIKKCPPKGGDTLF